MSSFRFSTLFIILIVGVANAILWIRTSLPFSPEASRYPIPSLSYNPFQRDQDPLRNDLPRLDAIRADFALLRSKTKNIRLYNTQGLEALPAMASRAHITLYAGAWLDRDSAANKLEVSAAISLAGKSRQIKRLIIGNESLLKKLVTREELMLHLETARKRLRTPVSSAEPWDFWINDAIDHPKDPMANHVDFITIHVLPYWMGIPIEQAADYVIGKYYAVKERFPNKVVIIGETGWPSDGPQRGEAVASVANQARFTREFIRKASERYISFNIIEAFDQPWKSALEGRAGEHFGIMDAQRQDKFPFEGAVLEDRNWEIWCISSMLIGLAAMISFFWQRPIAGVRARLFAAIILQAGATSVVQLARTASDEYMSAGDIAFWTAVLIFQLLLAIIFVTDTAEIADVVGRRPLRRMFPLASPSTSTPLPFVSIHVAACREPPELLKTTIASLAALDYPHFEVLIIDNNTTDDAIWKPVEEYCKGLGPRFKFFSLGPWPGFKAGALNFALRQTDPRAQVIGVIDADYVVQSNWLKATVPYFADPEVALVQAPQEHRDVDGNIFQLMENDEYSGFFRIGMVQRNEDDAIIQHGTMTLMRRSTMDELHGWAEWCICEDSELGLRIYLAQKRSVYVNHPLGHGLVPDSYAAYAKQRSRWAYGGMRIFRRYWKEVFGFKRGLRPEQRYQFLKGWLPWIGDALHAVFTLAAITWTTLLVLKPLETDFPEPIFVFPALALVGLRVFGTIWTYAARVKVGPFRTTLALLAGGSLTHTIAKSVFLGLLTSKRPFHRTPKLDNAPRLVQSLISVWQEVLLLLALWAGAVATVLVFGIENDDAIVWAVGLCAQSLPYLAALLASCISTFSSKARESAVLLAPSIA